MQFKNDQLYKSADKIAMQFLMSLHLVCTNKLSW